MYERSNVFPFLSVTYSTSTRRWRLLFRRGLLEYNHDEHLRDTRPFHHDMESIACFGFPLDQSLCSPVDDAVPNGLTCPKIQRCAEAHKVKQFPCLSLVGIKSFATCFSKPVLTAQVVSNFFHLGLVPVCHRHHEALMHPAAVAFHYRFGFP